MKFATATIALALCCIMLCAGEAFGNNYGNDLGRPPTRLPTRLPTRSTTQTPPVEGPSDGQSLSTVTPGCASIVAALWLAGLTDPSCTLWIAVPIQCIIQINILVDTGILRPGCRQPQILG